MWFDIRNGNNLVKCRVDDSVVHIPDGVKKIGAEAFSGSDRLRRIRLPAGLRVIGDEAFRDCCALEKITIPASVEMIGKRAFYGCTALTDFNLIRPAPGGRYEDKLFIGAEAFSHGRDFRNFAVRKGRATIYCTMMCTEAVHKSVDEPIEDALRTWYREKGIRPKKTAYCGTEIYTTSSFYDPFFSRKVLNYFCMIVAGDYGVTTKFPKADPGVLLRMYEITPEDEAICSYIERYLPDELPDAVARCADPVGMLEKFLKTGRFFTKQNIDAFIAFAIAQHAYELQMELMNYKRTHLGYVDAEERFRL